MYIYYIDRYVIEHVHLHVQINTYMYTTNIYIKIENLTLITEATNYEHITTYRNLSSKRPIKLAYPEHRY